MSNPAFVKKTTFGNSITSPVTATFVGGNTNGNIIIVPLSNLGTTLDTVTGVTDTEGNTYFRVAYLNPADGSNNARHTWYVAVVDHGSGSDNVVSVALSSVPTRAQFYGVEYSGLKDSPFGVSAVGGSGGTSVSYSATADSINDLILTCCSRSGGGVNWSGLSGTDRTGVTNTQYELNDLLANDGPNTITATSGGSGLGTSTLTFKRSGSGGFTSGRELTSALANAIAASAVRPVYFVEAFFATGVLRVWSGIGSLAWNGFTWAGVGTLGTISELPETASLQAQGITLSLSGIPSSLLTYVLSSIRQGEPCRVWFGLIDSSNSIIADPYQAFAGRIDVGSIDEGADTCSVSITVENMLVNFQRANEHRYTDADQQLYYPGDKGFEYVGSVQQWSGFWGRANSAASTKPGTPGGGVGSPKPPSGPGGNKGL